MGNDVVLWREKGDIFKPNFISKAIWQLIREEKPIKVWWKGLWFSYNTLKYAFHSWLAIHDRLSTGDRMLKKNVGANGSCIFCQSNIETRDHLYFACRFSKEVWSILVQN